MTKKIIFWLNSSLTLTFVAKCIKDTTDSQLFSIVDCTQKNISFFKKQTDVIFDKQWFLHSDISKHSEIDYEFLKKMEESYELNLWNLAINERIFHKYNQFHKFTPDEILLILQNECKFFENILNECKPDFFITYESALHYQEIFYLMCKKRNVKILMLNQAPIGNRCYISSEYGKFSNGMINNSATANSSSENSLLKQITSYRDNLANQNFNHLKSFLKLLFSKNDENKINFSYFGHTKTNIFFKYLALHLQLRNRNNFINSNLEKNPSTDIDYIYFPLHMEPERSLLIAAPYFTNQLEFITSLAKSIPIEFKLFVKEHPSQLLREWRPISYYKELLSIPNVEVIHPDFDNTQLIKNSKLVITIGGSTGYEALVNKKPCISFVDMEYSKFPGVEKLENILDLPKLIKKSLTKELTSSDSKELYEHYFDNTFIFDNFGMESLIDNEFFNKGTLRDVEIKQSVFDSFLETYTKTFNNLAEMFVKNIK